MIPKPSLTSPVGGEVFDQASINVEWIPPSLTEAQRLTFSFEIVITDSLNTIDPDRSNWVLVGSVPASVTRFLWQASENINSDRIHLGVRTLDANGKRSSVSSTSRAFKRFGFRLDSPEVIRPLHGEEINGKLTIMLNVPNGMAARSQSRVFAQFSSQTLNISRFPILDNIKLLRSYTVDVSRLGNCDDGVINLFTKDGAGRVSAESVIQNIRVRNTGTFILDTVGPDVSVELAGGNLYVTSRDVDARLFAYDETTAIASCRFDQYEREDNGNLKLIETGEPRLPDFNNVINLVEGDGNKIVGVTAIDAAGNSPRISGSSLKTILRIGDSPVLSTSQSILYVEQVDSETYIVYRVNDTKTLIASLSARPLAAAESGGLYFFSLENPQGNMHVISVAGATITTVYRGTEVDQEAVLLGVHASGIIAFTASGEVFFVGSGQANPIGSLGGAVGSVRRLNNGNLAASLIQQRKIAILSNTEVLQVISI